MQQTFRKSLFLSCNSLFLLASCQPRNFNENSTESAAQNNANVQTACLSIQGNGPFMGATVGEITALLERNIMPVVIEGGSSGSIASTMARGVITNASVNKVRVKNQAGRTLTSTQNAAIVLGSTVPIIENFITMPEINQFGKMFSGLVKYKAAQDFVDASIGYPDQTLGHIENQTGQILMIMDFVSKADFTPLLKEPDYRKRNKMMLDAWVKFSDLIPVEPSEFAQAIFLSTKDTRYVPKFTEIRSRYFELFRAESLKDNEDPQVALKRFNGLIENMHLVTKNISTEQLENMFLGVLKNSKTIPFVGSLAKTASTTFYMPSPKKLWEAYQRESIRLPPGTIINSTFRKAEPRGNNGLVELTGLEHLYQGYFASPELTRELQTKRDSLKPTESFLEYPTSNGKVTIVPRDNIVVFNDRKATDAIRSSISEPNAFRRPPLAFSADELTRHKITLKDKEVIVPYGGWLDQVAFGTLERLDACKNAHYFTHVSALSPELAVFQRNSVRPVIDGGVGSFKVVVADRADPNTPVGKWMTHLTGYLNHAASKKGKISGFHLSFNWDDPSSLPGEARTTMKHAFWESRSAIFLGAYQHAAKLLDNVPGIKAKEKDVLFHQLGKQDLSKLTTPTELNKVTSDLVGMKF
jgi:hypothetical protein